jgi:probable HAF family extracellular repeat protein
MPRVTLRTTAPFILLLSALLANGCGETPPLGPRAELATTRKLVPTDLGTLGGAYTVAVDVNSSGVVVGYGETAGGEVHGFRWTKAKGIVDIGPGQPAAINTAGYVAGTQVSGGFAVVLWPPTGPGAVLPNPSGYRAVAFDINDNNEIVGYLQSLSSDQLFHGFKWTSAGGFADLNIGIAEGYPALYTDQVMAKSINRAGDIVGTMGDPAFFRSGVTGLSIQLTPTIGAGDVLDRVDAISINDGGQVALTYHTNQLQDVPAVWTASAGVLRLGSLTGEAEAIGPDGAVVGVGQDPSGMLSDRAFHYSSAGVLTLLQGAVARGLNGKGLTVGTYYDGNGVLRAGSWQVR